MTLKDKLQQLFTKKIDNEFYDHLEDLFIEADFGVMLAVELRKQLEQQKPKNETEALICIKEILKTYLKPASLTDTPDGPIVWLFLGVNGVGKTTTLAKVAKYFKEKDQIKVTAAAADTFRAAAAEQLTIHSKKGNFRLITGSAGGDPGAVVHDALSSVLAQHDDLLLVDTAGRMHNKTELVAELRKLDKIIQARIPSSNYKRILVIDANTGQNAVQQAEIFNDALNLSGLVLTKYDSMAKGGALVAIGKKLGLPIYFIGKGEQHTDLALFNVDEYLNRLLN